MKRKLIAMLFMVSVISALVIASPAMAASSQNVTVTAQPAYITITNTGGGWTLNGYATVPGDGYCVPSTSYYSNKGGDTIAPSATVVQAECGFHISADGSNVPLKLFVTMTDFAGGGANMTNGAGTAGVGAYAAWCYTYGTGSNANTFPGGKIIVPTAINTGTPVYTGTVAGDATALYWGVMLTTQSGDFSSGSSSTATLTITAQKK
jgi:hypothetical protein